MQSTEKNTATRQLYEVLDFPPPAFLSPFIQEIRTFATRTFLPGAVPWHIMPDGSSYLIFTLSRRNKQYRSRLVWVGPRTVYKEIDRKERLLNITIRFWPGSASLWLPMPLGEIADRSIHLSELWGEQAAILKQNISQSAAKKDINSCVRQLLVFLEDQLEWHKSSHPTVSGCVQTLLQHQAGLSIKAIATQLGVSDRYLRKTMVAQVGMSPKKLSRIFRVTKAVALADQKWPFGWAALANTSGYYDQAHMIDEFQALLGASPEAFITRRNREEV